MLLQYHGGYRIIEAAPLDQCAKPGCGLDLCEGEDVEYDPKTGLLYCRGCGHAGTMPRTLEAPEPDYDRD